MILYFVRSMDQFGSAADAAEILGLGLSAFNATRRLATYVYDPVTQCLTPLEGEAGGTPQEFRLRLSRLHLVAPTLAGTKLPGRPWEFNIDALKRIRAHGLPGAEYPAPK